MQTADVIELRVSDDGIGFDTQRDHPGHFGLVGMREQAQLVGADLHISASNQGGTTVRVRLRATPEELGV